ncbi:MAG: hypothetical protein PHH11_05760 [Methylomonas sp.]|nr:hypothetical protein [Methylomonas sp.]
MGLDAVFLRQYLYLRIIAAIGRTRGLDALYRFDRVFFDGFAGHGGMAYRHRRFPDLDIPPVIETVRFFVANGHKVFEDGSS